MEIEHEPPYFVDPAAAPWRSVAVLAVFVGSGALAGCVMDPPGPSPIYSRLPADQSGVAATAPTADARRTRTL